MGITIGVDLGTTNSVVAKLNEDGDPEIIKNSSGDYKTPSVVQIREDETVIGDPALGSALRFPERTIQKVKRHMGDEWTEDVDGTEFSPEEISALILEKLVKDTEEETGEEVDSAVITVPADFSITERQATKDAAQIAGLEVDSLLNEPTAACLRYGLTDTAETVLIYDLGGGTFDVTVVDIAEDGKITVDGSRGAQRLGGEDFDDVVYDQIILPAYVEQTGEEPGEEMEWELRKEAKRGKEDLSEAETTWPTVPGFEVEVTRQEFEEATEDIVENTIDTIEDLFNGDNVSTTKDEVDRILLAGGSTRIPAVQERVAEYFGMDPSKELDQDFVVAEGAAMASEIDVNGGEGGGEENDGGGDDTQVTNVVARTIGVEVQGEGEHNESVPIIEQDTPVQEAHNSKRGFTTTVDNQDSIEVNILEGDSDFAPDNDELGSFILDGIEEEPAGVPEFEIMFDIDEDGVLQAEAEDLDTGKSADTTLEIGLTDKEIEEAIQKKTGVPGIR